MGYTIPKEIDNKIPKYFYLVMVGELCTDFGPNIFKKLPYDEYTKKSDKVDENDSYYDLAASTYGWYDAFKEACKKLDIMWLVDYWNKLAWYDSDTFDWIIETRIIELLKKL